MNLILTFAFSFMLSLILTPLTIFLARKYGIVDDPKKHKHPAILHSRIIPRAGGVPIFLAFLVVTLLTLGLSKQTLGIMLGGALLIIIGVIDDRYDLSNSIKLLFQILAALVVISAGVGIAFITNPFFAIGGPLGFGEVIRLDQVRIFFDFLGTHS